MKVSLLQVKKLLAAITIICYLAFTGGVVVNFHFCMDKLASTQLYGGESKICGKCGMHKDPYGCCQDEVLVVKIDDEQQLSSFVFQGNSPKPPFTLFNINSIPALVQVTDSEEWLNHSPPLLPGRDIYLQNRVFRI